MTPYQFDGCLRLKALDKDPQTEEIRKLWEEIERDGDCVSLKELAVGGGDLLAAMFALAMGMACAVYHIAVFV